MVCALGGKTRAYFTHEKKKLSTGIQNDKFIFRIKFCTLLQRLKKNQYLILIVEEAGRSTCQSSDLLIILGYDLFSHKQLSSKSNLYV